MVTTMMERISMATIPFRIGCLKRHKGDSLGKVWDQIVLQSPNCREPIRLTLLNWRRPHGSCIPLPGAFLWVMTSLCFKFPLIYAVVRNKQTTL